MMFGFTIECVPALAPRAESHQTRKVHAALQIANGKVAASGVVSADKSPTAPILERIAPQVSDLVRCGNGQLLWASLVPGGDVCPHVLDFAAAEWLPGTPALRPNAIESWAE